MGGGSTSARRRSSIAWFRLGLPVVSQNDGLLVRMMSSAVTPKDVVIVLSLGGYTTEIIESAAIARQYGAKVIAITPADTPLAEQADLLLPLLVRENDYIFKPSTSRYAMLAMVDVLATELAMANKPQAKDRLRRIKLALDSHRGGVDRQPLGD
nr:transcriptional regulator [Raoultella sp. NCTC 9187]